MKRFRFSLQAVRVVRAHQELKAREAFGQSVQALRVAEESLARVRDRVANFERTLAARRLQPFSAADEAHALGAYRFECASEAEAEKAARAARELTQQRRNQFLEARRRVEIVQRLEQKARERHRLETLREEQAAFDDTAAYRFVTRRSSLSA